MFRVYLPLNWKTSFECFHRFLYAEEGAVALSGMNAKYVSTHLAVVQIVLKPYDKVRLAGLVSYK